MRSRTLSAVLILISLSIIRPAAAAAPRWTRIGPEGGTVCALAASPSQPAVVYAGLKPGGVFRSADGGATWAFAGTGLEGTSVCHLAVDPLQPNRVWAGSGRGLFRSNNGGVSWVLRGPSGQSGHTIAAVAVDPRHPSTILTAFDLSTSLFRSQDGGLTWASVGPATRFTFFLVFDPHRTGALYAGTSSGLFKSLDDGTSWAPLTGVPQGLALTALAIDPQDSRLLYLATAQKFLRSTNGGASWTPVPSLTEPVFALAVSPAPPSTVYAATSTRGVLVSSNRGVSWRPSGSGISNPFVNAVAATPAAVVAGGDGGVYISRNRGSSWQSGHGVTATLIDSLSITAETPSRLYAEDRTLGVFKTVSGSTFWTALGPPTPNFYLEIPIVAAAPSDPQSVYLATAEGFFRRLDGAQQWTRLPWNACVGPTRLAVDPDDPAALVLSGIFTGIGCSHQPGACLLFKSTDAGSSWSCITEGLPSLGGPVVLGFDPLSPQSLYLSGHDGLYHSIDGGDHWSLLAPSITPMTLAFSPSQAGLLYAALLNGVGRSTDGGATWDIHGNGLPLAEGVSYVAVDPAVPSTVYTATTAHVFRSHDGGATWEPLSNGLSDVTISGLAVDPSDPSILYVSTLGSGVLRLVQE